MLFVSLSAQHTCLDTETVAGTAGKQVSFKPEKEHLHYYKQGEQLLKWQKQQMIH